MSELKTQLVESTVTHGRYKDRALQTKGDTYNHLSQRWQVNSLLVVVVVVEHWGFLH